MTLNNTNSRRLEVGEIIREGDCPYLNGEWQECGWASIGLRVTPSVEYRRPHAVRKTPPDSLQDSSVKHSPEKPEAPSQTPKSARFRANWDDAPSVLDAARVMEGIETELTVANAEVAAWKDVARKLRACHGFCECEACLIFKALSSRKP